MSLRHLTANGRVDRGQPGRAAVGEGNGQPRACVPVGGHRGEGGVGPPALGPGVGDSNLEPGEMGIVVAFWVFFGRGRGGRPR